MAGAEFLRGEIAFAARFISTRAGSACGRLRGIGGRRGGVLRTRLGVRRIAATDLRHRLIGRRRVPAFAEGGHADHADVHGAAGTGGVTVGQVGEIELGDVRIALAPALHFDALPGVEHVTGLRGAGGLAADGIDAIDRNDGEHAFAGQVLQGDGEAMAGSALDVFAARVGQAGQDIAGVLVLHLHVHEALVAGAGGQGEATGQHEQGGSKAFHDRVSVVGTVFQRAGRRSGVNR